MSATEASSDYSIDGDHDDLKATFDGDFDTGGEFDSVEATATQPGPSGLFTGCCGGGSANFCPK